ncbi:MAG: hypothetical protein QOJ41_929 [Acidobacteriaceae bacterium]|jgi:hypothetical protein|nr:hypothetical protein [Acidobacteriaceae bacterium]
MCFLLTLATFFGSAKFQPGLFAAPLARTTLFPRLHAGQTFTYYIQYRTKKNVKTESRVVTPTGPQDAEMDAQWLLRVDVLDVHPQGERAAIHARSRFQSLASAMDQNKTGPQQSSSGSPAQNREAKSVDFTIQSDGHVDAVTGLADLFPDQRQVWQVWLRQFAIAGVFPRDGVKPGQSWKSSEPEQAPSPIVRLEWEKHTTYVHDEPCAAIQFSETGIVTPKNSQTEPCAVVLTSAILKQKSSPKDTTPSDFRLHDLHTTGNATGKNETISYISLQSGLVVRVTEDAQQFMDVVVAKTDASNQIHYNVEATGHTEVLLVADAPASNSK